MVRNLKVLSVALLVFNIIMLWPKQHETVQPPVVKIPFGEMQGITTTSFNSIVRLANPDGRSFCTGWVVDRRYAVTAAHCINKRGKIRLEPIKLFADTGEDTGITAQASDFDARMDLGLLVGDFSRIEPIRVNFVSEGFPRDPSIRYLACGFPLGQRKLFCSPFIPTDSHFFAIAGQGHLIPGMSGGPVINQDTGEVVGVNTAVYKDKSIVSPVQGFLGLFQLE